MIKKQQFIKLIAYWHLKLEDFNFLFLNDKFYFVRIRDKTLNFKWYYIIHWHAVLYIGMLYYTLACPIQNSNLKSFDWTTKNKFLYTSESQISCYRNNRGNFEHWTIYWTKIYCIYGILHIFYQIKTVREPLWIGHGPL